MPEDSLASTLPLRPFCLVRKKHRCPRWPWDTLFVPEDFSLVDALEPGSPIPGTSRWGWRAAEWRGLQGGSRKGPPGGESRRPLHPGSRQGHPRAARACRGEQGAPLPPSCPGSLMSTHHHHLNRHRD